MLGNVEWHNSFSQSSVCYLSMVGSDHRPVLAQVLSGSRRSNGSFQFDKKWLRREGFKEVVENGWYGTFMDRNLGFVDRIQKCRSAISRWKNNNPLMIGRRLRG